jgi:hypothetical protein
MVFVIVAAGPKTLLYIGIIRSRFNRCEECTARVVRCRRIVLDIIALTSRKNFIGRQNTVQIILCCQPGCASAGGGEEVHASKDGMYQTCFGFRGLAAYRG